MTDDGVGGTAPPEGRVGHGLIGMRERVVLLGSLSSASAAPATRRPTRTDAERPGVSARV